MRKRFHRGFYAEKYLKNKNQEQQANMLACGHFIEETDYFEKEKINMIKNFKASDIADDIYVAQHREDLV